MGIVTTTIRLILNLAAVGGSGMLIYGIVESRSGTRKALAISDSSSRSACLLWPTKGTDGYTFETSVETNCTYGIAAAVESLLLALLLTVFFIYNIVQKSTDKHSCAVMVEVMLLVCSLIMAVVAAIVVSGGIADLCSVLKALSIEQCSKIRIGTKTAATYVWYDDINIAQIGTWVLVAVWTLQLVFAAINCHSYRKGKRSADITTYGNDDKARVLSDPAVFEASKDDDGLVAA